MHMCMAHASVWPGGLLYHCSSSFQGVKGQEVLRGNSRQVGKVAARFEEVKSPVSWTPSQRSNPPLPPPVSEVSRRGLPA